MAFANRVYIGPDGAVVLNGRPLPDIASYSVAADVESPREGELPVCKVRLEFYAVESPTPDASGPEYTPEEAVAHVEGMEQDFYAGLLIRTLVRALPGWNPRVLAEAVLSAYRETEEDR